MGISVYYSNQIMDMLCDGGTNPAPSNMYLGLVLSSATVDEDDTDLSGMESDYTGYARVLVSNGSFFGPASGGDSTSILAATFPACTAGGAAEVDTWVLCDNATKETGNMLFWGSLLAAKTPALDDVPIFPIGTIVLSLT